MTHTPFVYKGMIESQNLNDFYDDLEAIEDNVEEKAEEVLESVVKHPIIQDGTWWIWNDATSQYEDSEVPATGDDITVVSVGYQAGTSPTTVPTGEWSESPVSVPQGQYLWTKVTYSDGNFSYSVARQGMDGEGAVVSVNGQSGVVELDAEDVNAIPSTQKGAANGVAELDEDGKVPEEQLPPISGGGSWGSITGDIEDQEDLQEALADASSVVSYDETEPGNKIWHKSERDGWKFENFGSTNIKNDMSFGNGVFVMLESSEPYIMYSSDGITWHPADTSALTQTYFVSLAFGNGKFVATSNQGTAAVSENGINWTEHVITTTGTYKSHRLCFDGQKFVAIPGWYQKFYTSVDGATWVQSTADVSGGKMIYTGSVYVVTGSGRLRYSEDLETWNDKSTDPENLAVKCVGNGKVIFSLNKTIAYTDVTDTTFSNMRTLVAPDALTSIRNIYFYDGLFYVLGERAICITSDFETWETMDIWTAGYSSADYMAVGKGVYAICTSRGVLYNAPILRFLVPTEDDYVELALKKDIDSLESKGKVTIGGTEYGIKVSTTDSGEAGYITFVTEA